MFGSFYNGSKINFFSKENKAELEMIEENEGIPNKNSMINRTSLYNTGFKRK